MNKRLRKKKQLRKYSFSNLDIWNACYTMAEFIYELLVECELLGNKLPSFLYHPLLLNCYLKVNS